MRPGFDYRVRKIPWRRAWQPSPVFLPGESHGQRSLAGCSPWGSKESDMTDRVIPTVLPYWGRNQSRQSRCWVLSPRHLLRVPCWPLNPWYCKWNEFFPSKSSSPSYLYSLLIHIIFVFWVIYLPCLQSRFLNEWVLWGERQHIDCLTQRKNVFIF